MAQKRGENDVLGFNKAHYILYCTDCKHDNSQCSQQVIKRSTDYSRFITVELKLK